jgi:hypothetical protein
MALELIKHAAQPSAGTPLARALEQLHGEIEEDQTVVRGGAREVVVEVCSQVLDAHRAHSLWSRGVYGPRRRRPPPVRLARALARHPGTPRSDNNEENDRWPRLWEGSPAVGVAPAAL